MFCRCGSSKQDLQSSLKEILINDLCILTLKEAVTDDSVAVLVSAFFSVSTEAQYLKLLSIFPFDDVLKLRHCYETPQSINNDRLTVKVDIYPTKAHSSIVNKAKELNSMGDHTNALKEITPIATLVVRKEPLWIADFIQKVQDETVIKEFIREAGSELTTPNSFLFLKQY
ncbi:hypothetical protein P9112_010982 [Eukaryota sp. TZLM1-RC]